MGLRIAPMTPSQKRRRQLIREFGHLYTWHAPIGQLPGVCFYCGTPAGSVDHVPPLAHADSFVHADPRPPFVLVSACAWCNTRLGDRCIPHLDQRVAFIWTKLSDEMERRTTLWSDEEIAEMGPAFRATLAARKRMTSDLIDRIRWCELRVTDARAYPEAD